MVDNRIFAMAGAVAIVTSSTPPEREGQLGVAATVVRPARISAAMTRPNIALVTLENSPGVEVLGEPEPVRPADGHFVVKIPRHTRAITITVTY